MILMNPKEEAALQTVQDMLGRVEKENRAAVQAALSNLSDQIDEQRNREVINSRAVRMAFREFSLRDSVTRKAEEASDALHSLFRGQ
jgi:hypothetical protein